MQTSTSCLNHALAPALRRRLLILGRQTVQLWDPLGRGQVPEELHTACAAAAQAVGATLLAVDLRLQYDSWSCGLWIVWAVLAAARRWSQRWLLKRALEAAAAAEQATAAQLRLRFYGMLSDAISRYGLVPGSGKLVLGERQKAARSRQGSRGSLQGCRQGCYQGCRSCHQGAREKEQEAAWRQEAAAAAACSA